MRTKTDRVDLNVLTSLCIKYIRKLPARAPAIGIALYSRVGVVGVAWILLGERSLIRGVTVIAVVYIHNLSRVASWQQELLVDCVGARRPALPSDCNLNLALSVEKNRVITA